MSFIYDANEMTPEELRRQREMYARAAMPQGIASNVGEGLAQLGQAIAGRIGMSRADSAIRQKDSLAQKLWSSLGMTPSAPANGNITGAAGSNALMGSAKAPSSAATLGPLIMQTAKDVGVDPVDLATAISYETAGTFNPTKGGPVTKWGKHRGLIQFGEPQARQYGVDWKDPVNSQLGPGKAVAQYLKAAGVKPGMGMLDLYSAINAGRVGRYGASDAAAGGAPGTVADKVNTQMAGHRAKAMALMSPFLNMKQDVAAVQPPPSPMGTAMGAFVPQMAPVQTAGVPTPPVAPSPSANVVPASAPPPSAPSMSAFDKMRMRQEIMAAERRNDPMLEQIKSRWQQRMGSPAPQSVQQAASPVAAPAMPDATGTPSVAFAAPSNRVAQLEAAIFSDPNFRNLSPAQQQFVWQMYNDERQRAIPPDPYEQRKRDLELQKLEQDVNPPAKPGYAPVTPDEATRLGLPPGNYQKGPDGKIELVPTPKVEGGFRPATTDEKKAYGVPPEAPLMMGPDGKPTMLGGGNTTVNVDSGASSNKIFDATKEKSDAAQAANAGLQSLNVAQKALPGAIMGAAANERLALQKVASLFGVGDTQAITDTETFRSAIAPQVAAMMKATVGSTQISNADREFAEKAAGGNITLDRGSIERLLRIMQLANTEIVRNYNAKLNDVYPEGKNFDRERALLSVPNAPKMYREAIGPVQPPIQIPATPSTAKDINNPQPGEIVDGFRFKGGDPADEANWEMVQ